jgi:ATP-dependent helicase HrpA
MQDIEDKVRARHLIDDYTIFVFYDSRIPQQIVSVTELKKVLPRINASLLMSEDDICNDLYDLAHRDKFPGTLSVDTFVFQLSYKFEPGSAEDGVSVLIPSSALQHINPLSFEWLVPGLLAEKVLAMLKSLPKSIRKHLVPVNKAAEALVAELHFGQGSLKGQLSALLLKNYQLAVENNMWEAEALPIHLKMRFCLTDPQGRVLKQTRDFNELFANENTTFSTPNLKELKLKWEKEQVESYEYPIPRRLPIETSSGLSGYAFPALVDRGNGTIGMKLFITESEQLASHRSGLLALYKKEFVKQVSICKKELKFFQDDWALFNWLGSLNDVNGRVQNFIFFELFGLNAPCFQTQEDYRQRVTELSNGNFFSSAASQFAKVRKTLAFRRETYDLITKFSALSASNAAGSGQFVYFFEELARLLPLDFLESFSMAKAESVWRAMEALRIRAERAYASPASDIKKTALISPFYGELIKLEEKLDALHVPARKKIVADLLDDLKAMIEEYKISVFAPEMKTLYKVSDKRLLKKVQDIRGQL